MFSNYYSSRIVLYFHFFAVSAGILLHKYYTPVLIRMLELKLHTIIILVGENKAACKTKIKIITICKNVFT